MVRTFLIAFAWAYLGIAPPASAAPDLGANAALKYWQAFAAMPKLTDAEQRKLNAECLTMPLDQHARELVAKSAYALRMLHLGVAQPACDWGIAYQEAGIEVLLPHNDGARLLSSLICLRARLRLEEGYSAQAIDDLIAGMILARHVAQDSVNVMLLAGYAGEHRMIEAFALCLPKLDARAAKELKKRLDALPPGSRPALALRVEERWALDWFIRRVRDLHDKDKVLAFLSQCWDSPEKGRQWLEASGGTAEGVLKSAEELRQTYVRMAPKLDLPLDQFEKEWDQEQMKQAHNPVFQALFPAIHKMRVQQARMDVRRAMLSAAIAAQQGGRDLLKDYPDPVVGGPFEYVPFEGGFELRSKWRISDELRAKWKLDERSTRPMTLTVGQHGK